ncbi:MAG: PEP-CTERM sorting domain-containing protein [Planctomycetota bacterium]|nr:MAG: PEP-CTERM sorting domain-containing protein [Planctomycetota bacterium]
MNRTVALSSVLVASLAVEALAQDTWQINMTVDNQYAAYVGTASSTVGSAVQVDSDWTTTESFTVTGMSASDYFYVATASDWGSAQGFLGEFRNLTQGYTFNTGSSHWEVLPAGAYLQQINSSWPSTWGYNQMPTQSEVDQALAWAASNSWAWVTPAEWANYDNRVTGNVTIWGHRSGIDPTAEWIWNNTGTGNPFQPGANHDEFLIFRVQGVPAPSAMAVLGLAGVAGSRRRRS